MVFCDSSMNGLRHSLLQETNMLFWCGETWAIPICTRWNGSWWWTITETPIYKKKIAKWLTFYKELWAAQSMTIHKFGNGSMGPNPPGLSHSLITSEHQKSNRWKAGVSRWKKWSSFHSLQTHSLNFLGKGKPPALFIHIPLWIKYSTSCSGESACFQWGVTGLLGR